jgi:hypothetical protein
MRCCRVWSGWGCASRSKPERVAFSIVETAKANGVEPDAYPSLLFERLPHAKTVEDFEALLPWNVKHAAMTTALDTPFAAAGGQRRTYGHAPPSRGVAAVCRLHPSPIARADFRLVFDAGPLKGLCPFPERAVFDYLATAKHEAIGKSSANPFGRILETYPGMEIHDNFIAIRQEPFGLACSFGPSTTPLRDVLLHFRNTTISPGCRKALWLDAYDLRIEIPDKSLHVIAIDCSEELLEYFICGVHGPYS